MLKLKILSVGKNKEKWLDEAFSEYVKRIKSIVQIECLWVRDTQQLIEWTQKEPHYICLDPTGDLYTSEEFSKFLFHEWEIKGSRLTFLIGGAEGIPEILKQNRELISFSPLTFTHQMARLILIEQVYRSIEIQKGSNYHK